MELLEGEVFKPLNVEGYEKYLVSNKGRVSNGEIIMKQAKGKLGYMVLNLCSSGVKKRVNVHRLVALTFLKDGFSEGLIVNHIDSKRDNNVLENLEWVTHKQNTRHGIDAGNISMERIASQAKFAASKAKEKLSKPVEVYHKGIYTIYESVTEAHKETGLSKNVMRKILNGKRTDIKGYEIEYV